MLWDTLLATAKTRVKDEKTQVLMNNVPKSLEWSDSATEATEEPHP